MPITNVNRIYILNRQLAYWNVQLIFWRTYIGLRESLPFQVMLVPVVEFTGGKRERGGRPLPDMEEE